MSFYSKQLAHDDHDSIYNIDSYWVLLVLSPIVYSLCSCAIFIVCTMKHYINNDNNRHHSVAANQNSTINTSNFTIPQKLLFLSYKFNHKSSLLLSSYLSLTIQLLILVAVLVYGWNEHCGGASGIILHWLLCMRIATLLLSYRITANQLNTNNHLYNIPLSDKAAQLGWCGIVYCVVGIVPIVYKPLYTECSINAPYLHHTLLGVVGIALVQIMVVAVLLCIMYKIKHSIQVQSNGINNNPIPTTYQSGDNAESSDTSPHQLVHTPTTSNVSQQLTIIMIRCVLRHLLIGLVVAPQLLDCQLDESDPLCGLELTYLPVTPYDTMMTDPTDVNDTCCSICLTDYINGDSIKQLSCTHKFHSSCLDHWLSIRSNCAMCRSNVSIMAMLDHCSIYSVLFNRPPHDNSTSNNYNDSVHIAINTQPQQCDLHDITPATPLGSTSTPRRYRTLDQHTGELSTVA